MMRSMDVRWWSWRSCGGWRCRIRGFGTLETSMRWRVVRRRRRRSGRQRAEGKNIVNKANMTRVIKMVSGDVEAFIGRPRHGIS